VIIFKKVLKYPRNIRQKYKNKTISEGLSIVVVDFVVVYNLMAYKNKNIVKDGPFFTHFLSLPFL